VLGLGGGSLLWVWDHSFGRWLTDAVACVLLDGFDDGEDAFFGFSHGAVGISLNRPSMQYFRVEEHRTSSGE